MAYLINEKMRGYIIRYTLKIGPDYTHERHGARRGIRGQLIPAA